MYSSQTPDRQFALTLTDAHWRKMAKCCRRNLRSETGGILIGRYDANLRLAELTEVLGPPRDSKAGPTWFERGTYGVNAYLAKVQRQRGDYYVGEWHFHPTGPLNPSPTDIKHMSCISANRNYKCPEPILVIVGHPGDLRSYRRKPSMSVLRSFVFPRGKDWQELRRSLRPEQSG